MKNVIAATLLLILALPATALAQDQEPPPPKGLLEHYLEGAGALAENRLDDARQAYEAGLAKYPGSPHLNLGLARVAAAANDTAAALGALARVKDIGGIYDLVQIPEFQPYAEDPGFAPVFAAMHPDAHPTPDPAAVHVLEDPQLWNEGIACDLATGDLYAGSVKQGRIVRLRGGVQEDFGTTAQDGLLEVIGLDIDEARRRLWAATGRDDAPEGAPHDFGEAPRENEIVVYDLETGEQLRKYALVPDGRIHMWNDVTVAPDGTAWFTDMTVDQIWRIPPGGEPEPFLTLEADNNPNGIVAGKGGLLYVACLEEILVVDTADGWVGSIERRHDVCTGLGDGLAYGDGKLYITQNSGLLGLRILECRLDSTGRKIVGTRSHRWTQPEGRQPYTCALGPGVLYVNATAPFAQYDDPEPPPPSAIVEIGL